MMLSKKLLFVSFFLLLIFQLGFAQPASLKKLNEINRKYSVQNTNDFQLLGSLGILEQRINAFSVLRIHLNELSAIRVAPLSFSVNLECPGNENCMNIIKNDTLNTPIPATAFFMNDAASANEFASTLASLRNEVDKSLKPIQPELIANVPAHTEKEQKTSIPKVEKKQTLDEEDEQEPEAPVTKEIKTNKNTKATKPEEENGDDETEDKKTKRSTKEAPEDQPENTVDPLCKQLELLLQSGCTLQFSDITGKETNPDLHINESKLKLKGARKNYISWYKNRRAFIAEFKTGTDRELVNEEFGKIQTTLEDCLSGNWEDTDHSDDPIYKNSNEEIKDVEYINVSKPNDPHFRLLIHSEENRHTIFLRVQ